MTKKKKEKLAHVHTWKVEVGYEENMEFPEESAYFVHAECFVCGAELESYEIEEILNTYAK